MRWVGSGEYESSALVKSSVFTKKIEIKNETRFMVISFQICTDLS